MLCELPSVHPCGLYDGADRWHGQRVSVDGAVVGPFEEEDVEEVLFRFDNAGENGDWEGSIVAVVRLKDGRYVAWETSRGLTGDGFHEDAYGGHADIYYANDLGVLLRLGLTDDGREKLGIEL